jgi:gluconokinase
VSAADKNSKPSIILLMGVAGSGKTTTGERLSRTLGWAFRDADSFHPAANVEKMKSGVPLTDADRWPWLDAIGAWMDDQKGQGMPGIVSCSALKRVYRDRLLAGRAHVGLVYLSGSKALISERMSRRKNHFMPPALLDSQFATLEPPDDDEKALIVDVGVTPDRVVQSIIAQWGLIAAKR